VSFVVKASLFPAGAVPKALDAVSQVHNLEVYKQSERFATQLEVGEIGVHGLGFDDDEIFDPQVDPASRHHRHWQTGLSRRTHPDLLEFRAQNKRELSSNPAPRSGGNAHSRSADRKLIC
jgi:hypothetical protein